MNGARVRRGLACAARLLNTPGKRRYRKGKKHGEPLISGPRVKFRLTHHGRENVSSRVDSSTT